MLYKFAEYLEKKNFNVDFITDYRAKKFIPLIKEMEKNKLIFFTPIECAKHINNHYDTINDLWCSKKVMATVNKYRNQVYYVSKNKKIKEWSNFIKP